MVAALLHTEIDRHVHTETDRQMGGDTLYRGRGRVPCIGAGDALYRGRYGIPPDRPAPPTERGASRRVRARLPAPGRARVSRARGGGPRARGRGPRRERRGQGAARRGARGGGAMG